MKYAVDGYVVIDTDLQKNDVTSDGFLVATTYDKYHDDFCVQDGVVVSSLYPEVKAGDHVYTSKYLSDDEYRVDGYQKAMVETFICKIVDGEIHMLNDFNLLSVEEALKEESGFQLIDDGQHSHYLATMQHSSCGINKGQKVIYRTKGDYKVWVEGELYLRVLSSWIVAEVDDGIIPRPGWMLCFDKGQADLSDFYISSSKKATHEAHDMYSDDVFVYERGRGVKFTHEGINYLLLRESDILYKKSLSLEKA